jgi:cell division septation protein DedD
MQNWFKNLLFVLFSFVFLGLGVLMAELLIREKGNPLKDPEFLTNSPVDTNTLDTTTILPSIDTSQYWKKSSTIALPPTTQKLQKTVSKKPKIVRIIPKPNHKKAYLVITGMFRQKANMIREIKKLKAMGYKNAYSFSRLSLNAVSAGHFEKAEAQKVASALKRKGLQAIVKHQ